MPQLVSPTSSSYPFYLDSINDEAKFSIEHFDEKNHHHSHRKSKEQLIDFNFFYENLLGQANNFYSLNSPLLNESFNYCLNNVYHGKNGNANSEQHKSFSIDSILGFANKDAVNHHYSKQHSPVHLSGGNDYLPHSNYQYSNKTNTKQSLCFNTIPANKLSANLTEEHIKLNSEPFKCSLGEKKKGLKINKKGKKSLKQISSSEINKIVDFGGTNKSKRVRTIFTPEQLERLETEFEKQQYMVGIGRLYLASTLNLTEAQVKVWFQNRRIKWRKQHLEGSSSR